jgi:PKD repeat protein
VVLQLQALFLFLVSSAQSPPVADFSASPTNGSAPLSVTFTDASSGTITAWSWTFGDGGTSTAPSPTHAYGANGTYDVSLTVTGPGGSDTETKTGYIVVAPAPVAQFFGAPISGTVPLTVSFTNLSSNATNHAWTFGDGGTSTVFAPGHVYTAAGSYTVELTATGAGGTDVETKVNYVTVNHQPPVAAFTAAPTDGFAPLTVSFTDASTGGPVTSWSWTFGDGGTSTQQNPTHVYATKGTYTVALTAIGPGGSSTKTQTGLVSVSGQKTRRKSLPRPNVVLVVLDDVGVERVGAYQEGPAGVTPPCTPNLDALAANGVLFRRAYGNPLCSPTRAQLLTGRHGFRTGIGTLVEFSGTQLGLSVELEDTLPELLVGYDCAATGKWHLANPLSNGLQHPLDSGFRTYAGSMYNLSVPAVYCGDTCVPPDCSGGGTLGYSNWVKTWDPLSTGILQQTCSTTYATTDTTDETIARAQVMQEPWFVMASFNAAHLPFEAPPTSLCHPLGTCTFQYCQQGNSSPAELTDAVMEAFDSEFGRMVTAIRAVDPDTLFIVISDNGTDPAAAQGTSGGCWDPNRVKGTVYEGGIRVPLIISGSDVVPGECTALVSATDVLATLCELAHVTHAADDSVSLVPYLHGDMTPRRTTVYSELFTPNFESPDRPGQPAFAPTTHTRSIRNDRYKLLRFTSNTGLQEEQFFDLLNDPCESTDLCPGFGACGTGSLTPDQATNLQALRDELVSMGVY